MIYLLSLLPRYKLYSVERDIIMKDTLTRIETDNRVLCTRSNIHLFYILWHDLFCGGFSIIFMKHNVSEADYASVFRQSKHVMRWNSI